MNQQKLTEFLAEAANTDSIFDDETKDIIIAAVQPLVKDNVVDFLDPNNNLEEEVFITMLAWFELGYRYAQAQQKDS